MANDTDGISRGSEPPTVACWRLNDPFVVVLCPHCGGYHIHRSIEATEGGRCTAECPSRSRGYSLPIDPQPAPEAVLRDMVHRRSAGNAVTASDADVQAWIAETCHVGPGCTVPPSDLSASWKGWAGAHGIAPGAKEVLTYRLKGLGYTISRETSWEWIQAHKKSAEWVVGLSLKEPGPLLRQFKEEEERYIARQNAPVFIV